MSKSLTALLRELDAANPFRSAELARQLDAATDAVRRQVQPISHLSLEPHLSALLEQHSRQVDALTEAARSLAEPYEHIRAEQERVMDGFKEQQDRLASAIREQTTLVSDVYRQQFAELARRQSELEETIKALTREQERLKKLIEERELGA